MWRSHSGAHRKAFRAIARLRELRSFEKLNFYGIETPEDRDLLYEIGWRQASGKPLTMKQALLLDIGSVATVQRRLRQLRRLGAIDQHRMDNDRRVQELTLSAKSIAAFARCDDLLQGQESWDEAA